MADFIIGPDGNVYKTGLPSRIGAGAKLPVPTIQPVPQLPAVGPQNFTLGPSGPTISPAASIEPRLLPSPPPSGGASVPPGGGIPKPPTLGGRAVGLAKGAGRFAKGAAGPTLALGLADAAVGQDPEPNEFGITNTSKGHVSDPLPLLMGQGIQSAYDLGKGLENQVGGPDTSPGGDFLRLLAGQTLQSPARITKGVKNIAEHPVESLINFGDKTHSVVKGGVKLAGEKAGDIVWEHARFIPEIVMTRKAFQEKQLEEAMLPRLQMEQDKAQVAAVADEMFKNALGEGGTSATITEPFTLGNVQFPSVPNFSPPPPAADFTEVYETLRKTMPQDPGTQDFQTQSTIAVLAGMMSGVLQARDGDLGSLLLGAGIGGLAGKATIDQAKQDAMERFKAQLDDFHIRWATVQRREAESDAQHAHRVWEHNNANLLRQYNAANARAELMNQKVTNGPDGQLYLTSITDNGDGTGTRQIRVYQPGKDTATAAGMIQMFKPLVGKEKAETIASQILTAKSPEKGLGLYIVAKAKADGKYESLLNNIEQISPDFLKEMGQVGNKVNALQLGATESERGELIQNERDAFLIEVLMSNPRLLGLAGDTVGLTVPQGSN